MAGKPELSVTPQSQNQGVQNVVVYVSNDNIAQAYAVGQQNVSNFQQSQHQSTSQQQNGAVVYANNAQTMLPSNQIVPQTTNKTYNKNQTNGILENGSIANNFFVQNGFQQQNITYQNQNQNNSLTNMQIQNQNISVPNQNIINQNQNIPVQNQNVQIPNQNIQLLSNGNFNDNMKNIVGFNATSEIFAVQSDKQIIPRSDHKLREETASTESYISADSGFVVMSAESQGQNSVVFPRCDSVRSETAESSCSSLSSGDSQTDGVVLQSHHQTNQTSGDIVMYDNNGVSVNVRSTQPLGNLVLTMVPQASQGQQNQQQVMGIQSNVTTTQQQQQNNQQGIVNQITIPFGWKRLVTNGIVLYIR